LLNLVVVAVGLYEVAIHPEALAGWKNALNLQYGAPLGMIGAAMLLFPKLALGLSGFETGVLVMPLISRVMKPTPLKIPPGAFVTGKNSC
jgi:hypothetical protein